MRKIAAIVGFFVAFFAVGIYFDDVAELSITAVLAATVSVGYTRWASGSRAVAAATVVLITLVIPVVALILIAEPCSTTRRETP